MKHRHSGSLAEKKNRTSGKPVRAVMNI